MFIGTSCSIVSKVYKNKINYKTNDWNKWHEQDYITYWFGFDSVLINCPVLAFMCVCLCFCVFYLLIPSLSVCFYTHLSDCQVACLHAFHSHSVCLPVCFSLSWFIHLCVYLAYSPDPACSPRFMKCEQLSRWCILYSGWLCVGFVPQTKAYDTCEPLDAQTHEQGEIRLLTHERKTRATGPGEKNKEDLKGE